MVLLVTTGLADYKSRGSDFVTVFNNCEESYNCNWSLESEIVSNFILA